MVGVVVKVLGGRRVVRVESMRGAGGSGGREGLVVMVKRQLSRIAEDEKEEKRRSGIQAV